jgi:hypothetical protein
MLLSPSLRGVLLRSVSGAIKRRGNPDINVCFNIVTGLLRQAFYRYRFALPIESLPRNDGESSTEKICK